jgi:hypothetical protein
MSGPAVLLAKGVASMLGRGELIAISPMSGNPSRVLFEHQVLGKYQAEYCYDEKIGYIFVRRPHWLGEAYSEAVSSLDTGILARNLVNSETISRCLLAQPRVRNGVDLGAGYGLFVRAMRDVGFNFYWSDKYASNLLARGFEAEPGTKYDVAVAFEVLEHVHNPVEFLGDARNEFKFETCFFSATCFDEQRIPGKDWWYWVFDSGQHISFFSKRSLLWMAEQLGMRLCHISGDVFAFSNLEWSIVESGGIRGLWKRIYNWVDRMLLLPETITRPNSLTWSDHIKLRDRIRNDNYRL